MILVQIHWHGTINCTFPLSFLLFEKPLEPRYLKPRKIGQSKLGERSRVLMAVCVPIPYHGLYKWKFTFEGSSCVQLWQFQVGCTTFALLSIYQQVMFFSCTDQSLFYQKLYAPGLIFLFINLGKLAVVAQYKVSLMWMSQKVELFGSTFRFSVSRSANAVQAKTSSSRPEKSKKQSTSYM